MAVASSYGFCAIFSLKEAHEIAKQVESSNPAHPKTFAPFIEVRGSLLALEFTLTSPGKIHKNGWSRPKDGFPPATFAHEEPGYAASPSGAEKRNVYSCILVGCPPGARECQTKPRQWPEITT